MAYGDPYLSTSEFRARVGSVGTADDAALDAVLRAASRQVDRETGRRFDQTDTAESRYFTARDPRFVDIDDLVSLTALATDDGGRAYATVWAATDYDLAPGNAALVGRPYEQLRTTPHAGFVFGNYARGVLVTGVWGWPAIPDEVKEATFLIANRQKSLWNAPFGVTGGGMNVSGMRFNAGDLDPYICGLLAAYTVIAV